MIFFFFSLLIISQILHYCKDVTHTSCLRSLFFFIYLSNTFNMLLKSFFFVAFNKRL
jgi:predicted membrane channel-forming protein YqfA (hemolysin III family)